jgi:hypothetical protein
MVLEVEAYGLLIQKYIRYEATERMITIAWSV